jgi:mono/diheme cytochrome c family protein/plastocyanin
MKLEWLARLLLVTLALGWTTAAIAARWKADDQVVEMRAKMPEAGGWMPGHLTARVGEPLRVRLTSDDVMHGFAIGRSDQPAVDVKPGQVTEVTLTFDKPGTYTYACTRWCGPNHWRMRGTIEVGGEGNGQGNASKPLPYLDLGIDLDAAHKADVVPARQPKGQQGAAMVAEFPEAVLAEDFYLRESPADIWLQLRDEGGSADTTDAEIWDLVAYLWQAQTTAESLTRGQLLYGQHCAACHGESGAGNGVMALAAGDDGSGGSAAAEAGGELVPATDFTDPQAMLGASSALLQGKIQRGGMGTGMPSWGTILTDEQSWALVDYLWTFQFQMQGHGSEPDADVGDG